MINKNIIVTNDIVGYENIKSLEGYIYLLGKKEKISRIDYYEDIKILVYDINTGENQVIIPKIIEGYNPNIYLSREGDDVEIIYTVLGGNRIEFSGGETFKKKERKIFESLD